LQQIPFSAAGAYAAALALVMHIKFFHNTN